MVIFGAGVRVLTPRLDLSLGLSADPPARVIILIPKLSDNLSLSFDLLSF